METTNLSTTDSTVQPIDSPTTEMHLKDDELQLVELEERLEFTKGPVIGRCDIG